MLAGKSGWRKRGARIRAAAERRSGGAEADGPAATPSRVKALCTAAKPKASQRQHPASPAPLRAGGLFFLGPGSSLALTRAELVAPRLLPGPEPGSATIWTEARRGDTRTRAAPRWTAHLLFCCPSTPALPRSGAQQGDDVTSRQNKSRIGWDLRLRTCEVVVVGGVGLGGGELLLVGDEGDGSVGRLRTDRHKWYQHGATKSTAYHHHHHPGQLISAAFSRSPPCSARSTPAR